MPAPNRIEVTVESPVRGANNPGAFGFLASECAITNTWGLQPGTALLTWVKSGEQPDILPMSAITIKIGGHTFRGITSKVTPTQSSDGNTLSQEFLDSRILLQYDVVYGVFNRRHDSIINGEMVRGYKSLLPNNYDRYIWNYHSDPYTAREILDLMFSAPTIESPWYRFYVNALDIPIYDVDCENGKKLGTAIMEVSQRCGATFSLKESGRYDLVWVVKGLGPLPIIPSNADVRRSGLALSDNPSRLRILGDRNIYHTLNVVMEPDWLRAWEQFFSIDEFWYDIFLNESLDTAIGTIPAGTRYNAITDDVDFILGKQLARARALVITVSQYANLRDARAGHNPSNDGRNFRDFRRFQGRSRMQLPAALYISALLFRAFRIPANFRLKNWRNQYVPVSGLEIIDDALVEVSHNPNTGVMSYDFVVASMSNGYAIIQGYQIGSDGYKTLHPDQVDISKWVSAQDIWQHIQFTIDSSAENDQSQFILFDDPVFRVADMLVFPVISGVTQDYPVLKLKPTFTIPPVRAALVLAAERFSWWAGYAATIAGITTDESSIRDEVENVPGLSAQFVNDANGSYRIELVFADGTLASQKAQQLAAAMLNLQYVVNLGGYMVQGSNATFLTSMIDRVTVRLNSTGLTEEVDFTSERAQNIGPWGLQLEPPRDMERKAQLAPLLPGQRELKEESNRLKNDAAFLQANTDLLKYIRDAFYNYYGFDNSPETVFVDGTTGNLEPGTPLWLDGSGKRAKKPDGTGSALTNPVFAGVVVFSGEFIDDNHPVTITKNGSGGIIFARVKGPVAIGDSVGYDKTNHDYLVSGSASPVGTVQDPIATTAIKLVKVKTTSASGDDWASPIVYAKENSYAKGKFVVIRPTDSIVSDGALDKDADATRKALPGIWKATQAVAPTTKTGAPGTPAYYVPQWPLPTADNPDAANVYWMWFSDYPVCGF